MNNRTIKCICPRCGAVKYGFQREIYICEKCNEKDRKWIEMLREPDDRDLQNNEETK